MIRVLVADDHPIVRSGIVGLLAAAEGIEVVGEAADGREAVDRAAALSPDVVLMDLRMPNLDGVAATAQILAATPGIRVLILTTYETDDQILGAIEAGASGYLLKAAPQAEIIEGVRSVAGGQTVLAPSIATKLVQRVRTDATPTPRLSARELEVLRLVAAGNSNPAVGRALFISAKTVETHVSAVLRKLQLSSRHELTAWALERKLL